MTVTYVFAVLPLLLALTFTVSALTKLAGRDGFKSALGSFGVPEGLRAPLLVLVPVVELAIAIGLLPAASAWAAAVGALVLLVAFTVMIITSVGGYRERPSRRTS
jgi:uncharacterized membrane protein YphA (DoxX/SURF4 family)